MSYPSYNELKKAVHHYMAENKLIAERLEKIKQYAHHKEMCNVKLNTTGTWCTCGLREILFEEGNVDEN